MKKYLLIVFFIFLTGPCFSWSVINAQTKAEVPDKYELSQNYPNPFNPTTRICFAIPQGSFVKISVFNMLGERVAVLANSYFQEGYHWVSFNGQNFPSGVYLYKIEAEGFRQVRKMMLIK